MKLSGNTSFQKLNLFCSALSGRSKDCCQYCSLKIAVSIAVSTYCTKQWRIEDLPQGESHIFCHFIFFKTPGQLKKLGLGWVHTTNGKSTYFHVKVYLRTKCCKILLNIHILLKRGKPRRHTK